MIQRVKKICNNGVLIETTTREDMERVLNNEKLREESLVTELPGKKRLQMIVYVVPTSISKKDFLAALRQQNLEEMDRGKFKDEVKISFAQKVYCWYFFGESSGYYETQQL